MASEPLRVWRDTVQDAHGDDVTIDAFDDGDVEFTVHDGRNRAHAVFTREGRDAFDRSYQEACRRADGEAPAAGAREHG